MKRSLTIYESSWGCRIRVGPKNGQKGVMRLPRRKFTKEFKLAAIRRLEQGTSIADLAREFEIDPTVLQNWQRKFHEEPGSTVAFNEKRQGLERRVAELERELNQRSLEVEFLKACVERVNARGLAGNPPSSQGSKKK